MIVESRLSGLCSLSDDCFAKLGLSIFLCKRSRPMLIAANKAVSIDYTLTNDAGAVSYTHLTLPTKA